MLAMFVACVDSEFAVEEVEVPAEDISIIHIGGIQNDEVEAGLSSYATRSEDDFKPVDAETKEWLLGPLFDGLDITYGAKGKPETQNVAILKLLKKDPNGGNTFENIKYSEYSSDEIGKIAEYSFRYRTDDGKEGEDAKWYGNGEHYFQGVFVPSKLRFTKNNDGTGTAAIVNDPTTGTAPSLKVDQSKDDKTQTDANYTLLERYLGMPADAYISATVGRIKLPFRHRLARVLAYVLIDPTMGEGVTIEGYKKDATGNPVDAEDAATSEIKFCNVQVLSGVEESIGANGHSILTPRWEKPRKVIPHFVEESGSKSSKDSVMNANNFIMYYNSELKTYIFPANDKTWIEANKTWNDAYEKALGSGTSEEAKRKAISDTEKATNLKRTLYGKVPCYDLIVRPTYKSEDLVMYDEDLTETTKESLATLKNSIVFEITLSNGLQYYKEYEFDLDANFQTIVYLRINRESIDYNSSGAEVWNEDNQPDGYYGVNNLNGNTLSYAGSSWQRAFRFSNRDFTITDGHYYGKDDDTDDDNLQDDDAMPWYPQYVNKAKWVEMFAEAYMDPATGKKGLHHGDYFILDDDIEIDATKLPDNFVFTGHLDGQDHTIKLINGGKDWTEYVETTEYSISPLYSDKNGTVYNLPTLYTKEHHDANYTNEDELWQIDGVWYLKNTLKHNEEVSHTATAEEAAQYNETHADEIAAGTVSEMKEGDKVIETPESYETTSDSVKKQDAYDDYIVANPTMHQALTAPDGTYYEKVGENFTDFNQRKPAVLYKAVSHTSGTTLFAGLNGVYDAAIGEANVHSETQNGHTTLVPYVDAISKTGWRAEVINTKISSADMFPAEAIVDGKYDVNKISGYIYNCWKMDGTNKTAIMPHTPALPKYQ